MMMKKITFQKTKSLKKLAVIALALVSFNTHAQIDLVQTTNNNVTAEVFACELTGTNITHENDYARLYNLTALEYGKFEVTKVSFGIHSFQLGTAVNYPVSVKVYASTGGLVEANWTMVGQQSLNITSSMVGTVVEVSFTTPALVTTPEMVIVLSTPDGIPTSTGFFPGANTSGQTASGYAKAIDCGDVEFIDIATFGAPNTCLILFPSGNPTPLCPSGNVFIGSQAEANQFLVDYPNCTEINGDLLFQVGSGSSDITDVSPFSNITSVVGSLQFNNNLELQNIDALENLSAIGGINMFNNGIQNVDVFSNLEVLNGNIYIHYNPLLENLNGFAALTEIGGHIDIEGNEVLSDVSGLQNISPTWNTANGLTIVNNPALAVCNLPNFCSYLLNPASTHPRTISGNLANCVDEEAVITMCTLSLSDLENAQTNVHPNPVNDVLLVSNTLEINHISVLNVVGQTVVNQEVNAFDTQIDMRSLPAGNYILKVASADKIEVIKIIKE